MPHADRERPKAISGFSAPHSTMHCAKFQESFLGLGDGNDGGPWAREPRVEEHPFSDVQSTVHQSEKLSGDMDPLLSGGVRSLRGLGPGHPSGRRTG